MSDMTMPPKETTIIATWTPLSDFLKRNPDYQAKRVLGGIALVKVPK